MSILEIWAVIVTVWGIWLTAKRRVLCWPINLIACTLYFKLFLDVRLYADMALQALFGIAIAYGWVAWNRNREQGAAITVAPLLRLQAWTGLTTGAMGAVAIGWFTSRYTNAALPWIDSALTSFSLVAQYWTARRHAASWLLWVVVDSVYVMMFVYKGLWLTAVLYAAMVGLAVLGYQRWQQAAKH